MTPTEAGVPIDHLRKIVWLDEETGFLFWLHRPLEMFAHLGDGAARICRSWNTKNAGKRAFHTNQGMGYLHGSIGNTKYLAHRVVYALHHGRWPDCNVDHIDGNKRNNRPANLRDVAHRENMLNQPRATNNTTGTTGVSFDKERGQFAAHITVHGRLLHLGRFDTEEAAKQARAVANQQHGFHANHGRNAL